MVNVMLNINMNGGEFQIPNIPTTDLTAVHELIVSLESAIADRKSSLDWTGNTLPPHPFDTVTASDVYENPRRYAPHLHKLVKSFMEAKSDTHAPDSDDLALSVASHLMIIQIMNCYVSSEISRRIITGTDLEFETEQLIRQESQK